MPTLAELRAANPWAEDYSDIELLDYRAQQTGTSLQDAAKAFGFSLPKLNTSANLQSGLHGYAAGFGSIGAAVGIDGAQEFADSERRKSELYDSLSTAPKSWDEVRDLGSFVGYAGRLGAQSLPYAAEFAATAGLGGLAMRGTRAAITAAEAAGDVGAATAARTALSRGATTAGVAGSYPSAVGDILSNQYEQAGQYDLGNAVVGGIPYAALNAVGIEGLATRGLTRGLGEGLTRSRLANAAIMGGVVGTSEGLSEAGQEVFNQYGRNAVDANYDPFGEEAQRAYKESMIGGAILGGIPGGAGGFIQRKREIGQNDNLLDRARSDQNDTSAVREYEQMRQIETQIASNQQYDGAMDRLALEREWGVAAQARENELYDRAMQQIRDQATAQTIDVLRTQTEGNQRQLFPGVTGQTSPEIAQAYNHYAGILTQRANAGDQNALEIITHPAAKQPDVLIRAAESYLGSLQEQQTPFELQGGVQGQLDLPVPEMGMVVPKKGKPVQAGLDLGEGGLPTDRIKSERGRKLADKLNALYNAGAMDEDVYQGFVNDLTSPNAARRHNKIQADLDSYGRVAPQTTTYGAQKRAERKAAETQMARDIEVVDGLVAASDMQRAAERRQESLKRAIVMASEKNQNGVARPAEVRRIFRDLGENPAWSNDESDFVRAKFEETRTAAKMFKTAPNEGGNFGIKEKAKGKAGKPTRARMTIQEKVTKDLMLSFNRQVLPAEVEARNNVAQNKQEAPAVKNKKQPVLAAAGAQRNLFNNPVGAKKGTVKPTAPVKPVPAPEPKPVAKKKTVVADKATISAKADEHPEAENVRRMIDRAYEKERFGVTELGDLLDLVAQNTDEAIMQAKVQLAGYARRDGGIKASQQMGGEKAFTGRIIEDTSPEGKENADTLRARYIEQGHSGVGIRPVQMPNAFVSTGRAIEKLFGVKIQFVQATGLSPEARFDGLYAGRNVLYVNIETEKPASFVVGHEFLHYLAKSNEDLFDRFTQAAMPLMDRRFGKQLAERRAAFYSDIKNPDNMVAGWEEVYADTFGDVWNDPQFWNALAKENRTVAQKALTFLKGMLEKIINYVRSEKRVRVTGPIYADFEAIRNLVLKTSAEAVGNNPYLGDADVKASAATATMNEVGAALSDGLTDSFGKVRRGGLATMMLNHIQEIYGKVLPIQQYDDAVRKMGSTARSYASQGKAIIDLWQNLPTEQFKGVSNLLIDSTLDKVWPNKAWGDEANAHLQSEDSKVLAANKAAYDKAVAAYNALGKDGKAAYDKVIGLTNEWLRKEFELRNGAIRSTYLPEIIASAGEAKDKLEAILKADNTPREERSKVTELLRGNKPAMELVRSMYNEIEDNGALLREIKGPYFPLMRFGEHLVVARSKEFMAAQRKLQEATDKLQAFRNDDAGIQRLDELREELAGLRREYFKRPSKIKQEAIKFTQAQIAALRKELKETSVAEMDDLRRQMLVARKAIKEMESNPKSYVMEKFESEAQAKRRRDELLGEFPEGQVYTGMASMWDKNISSVSKGFMTKLETRLGQTLGTDQAGKAITVLRSVFVESLHDQSSLRRQAMRRREVAGYSTDAMRVFASYIGQSSHKLANIEHFVDTQEALDEVRGKAKEKMEAGDDKPQEVANEISKRFAMGLEYTETPIQNAIAGFTHVMTLGMSPAYLLQQVAQTPMITIPLIAARVGAMKATNLTWTAFKDAWHIVKSSMDKSGSKMHYDVDFNDSSLNQGEKDLMKFLFEQGRIDILMEHDIGEVAQGKQKSVYSKFLGYSNWAARQIEITNRLVTGLASYRAVYGDAVKKMGAAEAQVYAQRYASKIIADSQVDYSNENAPRVMKHNAFFGAKIVMQFKKYQVAMATMVMRNAYQALKGATPEERSEARKILGGLFTTHFLMAGSLGLPIAAPIGALATVFSWAWPDDDEPDPETAYKNFLADLLGQDAADVVARGLPAAFGFDFSKRVGMGSLFNPVPFVRTEKEGKEQFNELVLSLLGPSVGVGGRLWDGANKLSDGDLVGAWGLMAPKYLSDPIKGLMLGIDGITTKDGNTRISGDQFDIADQVMRGLGIPLLEVQKYYERNAAFEDAKSATNSVRTQLMRDWNKAEDKAEALAAIAEFNERHTTDKITRANLLAHRKSAQNYAKGVNEQGMRVGKKDGEFAANVRF
jgi:hypothetical protein